MLPTMLKFTGYSGSPSAGASRNTSRAPVHKTPVNKGKGPASSSNPPVQRKKKTVVSKPSSKKRKNAPIPQRQNYSKMNSVEYSQLR